MKQLWISNHKNLLLQQLEDHQFHNNEEAEIAHQEWLQKKNSMSSMIKFLK
jgi:hypothetical protein